MRKWREIYLLHFLIFFLFPPSISISKKKTEHTRYEIIIMGRIRCEKSPQVVRALRQDLCFCFLTFLLQQYRIFRKLGEVVVR